MKVPWKAIAVAVGIITILFVGRIYANALGRANAEAERREGLQDSLAVTEASNDGLTLALAASDSARNAKAREDSIRIAALDRETDRLEGDLRILMVVDSVQAEDVNDALRDLGAVIHPQALPELRTLTAAYETRVLTLTSQVSTQQGRIEVLTEQRDIACGDAAREREGRSASDVLVAGLRSQITGLEEIGRSQTIELDALRSAVAPGFFTRLVQEAQLVAITNLVTASVVFLVTR